MPFCSAGLMLLYGLVLRTVTCVAFMFGSLTLNVILYAACTVVLSFCSDARARVVGVGTAPAMSFVACSRAPVPIAVIVLMFSCPWANLVFWVSVILPHLPSSFS